MLVVMRLLCGKDVLPYRFNERGGERRRWQIWTVHVLAVFKRESRCVGKALLYTFCGSALAMLL